MHAHVLFLAVSLFVGYLAMETVDAQKAQIDQAEAAAVAGNMAVYRNYVVAFAKANTSLNQAVADGSLGLPTWYRRVNGVENYVTAGKGYVYYSGAKPEATKLLYDQSGNSILVGTKRGGFLYNPSSGMTAVSLPAAIPEGSLVYADS